jgi:macrolide-specific efflux system membrane fusion protein
MKKIFLLTAFALLLPLAYLFSQTKKEKVSQVSSQEDWANELIFAGQVDAKRKVDLKFATSGKLSWVGVEEGDEVKKGQKIAALDQRELEKLFKKEMNDYMKERFDFEQSHDDYQEEKDRLLITDEIKRILEKAQYDLNNSVLDVEIRQLAIEYANLYSPINGIVTSIDQPIAGVHVTPATAVFTIADPNSLYFQAEIDEEEISQIKTGQQAKIILDAYPEQEFDTQVETISFAPIPGKTNPTYEVVTNLPSKENFFFRLGMDGEIEFNN